LFPHVSAAIQLSNEDKHPSKGDTIKYIVEVLFDSGDMDNGS